MSVAKPPLLPYTQTVFYRAVWRRLCGIDAKHAGRPCVVRFVLGCVYYVLWAVCAVPLLLNIVLTGTYARYCEDCTFVDTEADERGEIDSSLWATDTDAEERALVDAAVSAEFGYRVVCMGPHTCVGTSAPAEYTAIMRGTKRTRDTAGAESAGTTDLVEHAGSKMRRTNVPARSLPQHLAAGSLVFTLRVGAMWPKERASAGAAEPERGWVAFLVPMRMRISSVTGVASPEDVNDTSGRVRAYFDAVEPVDTSPWCMSQAYTDTLAIVDPINRMSLPALFMTVCATFHAPGDPDAIVAHSMVERTVYPTPGNPETFDFMRTTAGFAGRIVLAPVPPLGAPNNTRVECELYFPPPTGP